MSFRLRFRPQLKALEPRDQPAVGDLNTVFNGNGVATTTFNPGTEAFDSASALVVQPNGLILAVGSSQFKVGSNDFDFAIARYTPTGKLDPQFGTGGRVLVGFDLGGGNDDRANAVALQPDGRIVVAGQALTDAGVTKVAVTRLNTDGSLDQSFGSGGRVTFSFEFGFNSAATAVAVQSNGRIVLAGYTDSSFSGSLDFAVARLTSTGQLDDTFSGDGKAVVNFDLGGNNADFANALALAPDGRVVAAGTARVSDSPLISRFAVARFLPNGELDATFNSTGAATFSIFSDDYDSRATGVVVEPDGTITIGGYTEIDDLSYDFAAARLTPDGEFQANFGNKGRAIIPVDFQVNADDFANAIAVQPDGRILLAGRGNTLSGTAVAVVRLDPDGLPDVNFGTDGISGIELSQISEAFGVAVAPDGTIYVAGEAVFGSDTDFLVGSMIGDSPSYLSDIDVFTQTGGRISTVSDDLNTTTTYAINASGHLYRFTDVNPNGTFLAGNVVRVSASSDAFGRPSVYVLFDGGFLWRFSDFTGWSSIANNVSQFDAESVETLYVLFNGGFLWKRDTRGWSSVASNVNAISAGTDFAGRQQVAVLFGGNFLWARNEATGWFNLTSNVRAVSAGSLGNFYVIFNGNFLWRFDGSQWINLASNVFDVSAGEDAGGTSVGYVQFFGGFLWRVHALLGWSSVTSSVSSMAAGGKNSVIVVFDGGFLYINRPPTWTEWGGGF